LIELVLNLADQFFKNVLQCDHADRAAKLIDDNGKVQFSFEEELQQFFPNALFPARR